MIHGDSAPATKGDLKVLRQDLRDELASKADLKALRQELREELASKADLKALRQELRDDLASKADLKALRRDLAIEISKTNGRIDRLDESFSTKLNDGVSRILKVSEDFMAQVQKVDRHQIITSYRVDELEKRVRTLEAR